MNDLADYLDAIEHWKDDKFMTTEAREIDRDRLARVHSPEWFGDSGKTLANYPGQDKNYQDAARKKVDAILQDIEAQGFRIERGDDRR